MVFRQIEIQISAIKAIRPNLIKIFGIIIVLFAIPREFR